MDKCEICSKNAEHTHHINEQHNADQHGMIDHYHKNSKFSRKRCLNKFNLCPRIKRTVLYQRTYLASGGICISIFIHLGCINLGLVTIPIISAIRFNKI